MSVLLYLYVFNVYCWRDSVNTYIPIKTFSSYSAAYQFQQQKLQDKQDCYIEDYSDQATENRMKGGF